MKEIKDTPFYSKQIGDLPKGCQMCIRGEKLVLFITGICPKHCWYCPLSENRKDKDVIYANEWKITDLDDLREEIKLTDAKGAGITGGDPLAKIDRTCEYINLLKKEYGDSFHIHLYTTFTLVTKENMEKLHVSGLDEIRFHPDLDKKNEWSRINFASTFNWDIGLEIPAVPNEKEKVKEMIDFFEGKVKFLNINELEVSELNMDDMEKYDYVTKTDISHGVLGSEDMAKEILVYCLSKNLNVHYCTSKLKDKVQMQNRLKLRAKNVSTEFDIISDEGLLIRGVIYLKDLVPGIDFKKKLKMLDREEFIERLNSVKLSLEDEGLELMVDEKKLRLITYPEHIEQFAEVLKGLGYVPAIIEEDPTHEAFEVNRDFL